MIVLGLARNVHPRKAAVTGRVLQSTSLSQYSCLRIKASLI